jgi:hypothetical protein
MPAQPPPIPPISAQSFDLARLPDTDQSTGIDFHARPHLCLPGVPGEIVVCAANHERNRLTAPAGNFAGTAALPKARIDFGGGKSLGASLESPSLGNGMPSKRIMITGTIKF